jgi:hypothetical protein
LKNVGCIPYDKSSAHRHANVSESLFDRRGVLIMRSTGIVYSIFVENLSKAIYLAEQRKARLSVYVKKTALRLARLYGALA